MDLQITLGAGDRRGGLANELYARLREAILGGRLRAGEGLPATRALAAQLAVSRNTVSHAYERLIAEGFLVARVGAGTFVSAESAARATRRAPAGALQPRALWRRLAAEVRQEAPAIAYDFRVGMPDAGLFPWDSWRRLVARQTRARRGRTGHAEPAGLARLREAIARHVGVSRAVRAGADDLLITSGAQQALDLIARVLVEPGACVAIEEPGYHPARRLFAAHGAALAPVRVDAEGIDVAAIPDEARAVYVTPSHQFPLGMPTSLARRMALLAWAERRGAAIIEDDYDSEFRFDSRPLEPLQSLDRSGRVLYVGSFSKVLVPTLRLGFLVAPPSLMPALVAAKTLTDWHCPVESQGALAELIEDGLLARHIRRVTRTYAERRGRLVDALARHLAHEFAVVSASAGLHIAAYARDRRREMAPLYRAALATGVAIETLAPCYQGRPRAGIALGYGAIAASKIDEGIRRLAAAFHA